VSDETGKPSEDVEVKTGELADDQLETVAGGALRDTQVTSGVQKKSFRPSPDGDGTTQHF